MDEVTPRGTSFPDILGKMFVQGQGLCVLPDWALDKWGRPSEHTDMGCHSLPQGIFLTQESNPGLLHCRWILYCLSYEGSPQ